MKRREILQMTMAATTLAATATARGVSHPSSSLKPPAKGKIPVGFLISEGAQVIGPMSRQEGQGVLGSLLFMAPQYALPS